MSTSTGIETWLDAGGTQQGLVEVNPSQLHDMGVAAQGVAERIGPEVTAVLAPSDTAAASLPGWRTAAALDACTTAWAACLRGLAAEVDSNGAKLLTTAQNYATAERGLAQSFRMATAGGAS